VKITVSTSKVNSANAAAHKYFTTKSLGSLDDLAELTTSGVWSPCVWKAGERLMKNYQHCGLVALDFDGAVTLSDTKMMLEKLDLRFIITTTKSHQRVKRSGKRTLPAVDRFRVVCPAHQSFAPDVDQYRIQMKEIFKSHPGTDKACCDPARFYFPGKEIVAIRRWGKDYIIPEPIPQEVVVSERKQVAAYYDKFKQAGGAPGWVQRSLHDGPPVGERRPWLFKVSAALARCGWGDTQILNAVSRAPMDRTGISFKDFERHVRNGVERGRNG